jgi:hypothetical protein
MPGVHIRILKIFKRIKPLVGMFLTIEAVMLAQAKEIDERAISERVAQKLERQRG